MTILFLLCQYGVRSVDWCWGGHNKRDQKKDGVCILSQGTVNRVWTVFCIFIPWWLFVSSMVYIMTAGCISQKTEVTAQVSSLTVVVLLCAPHNLSGHTACQLTPWGDRMWVREPSDAAELLTYCRCLLAHVTVWMMLGGPQVYSFYTTATIALVKLCLYVTNWQRDNVTWHTTKYGDPFSEFVLCKIAYTQQWTHKHRKHTRSSGQPFMLRHPGSSWRFGALLKGTSVVVLRVERALHIHSSAHLQPPMQAYCNVRGEQM